LISVRSEVQVFPGPPRFAVGYAWRRPPATERSVPGEARRAKKGAVVWNGYGAIAQLGERVLCKHEVVGSIPSGSTSLRWLRQLRLGRPADQRRLPRRSSKERRRAERRPITITTSSAKKFTSHAPLSPEHACGISDIVKRRSIRVGSCKQLRGPSLSPDHSALASS
jgi:hypothetical protein